MPPRLQGGDRGAAGQDSRKNPQRRLSHLSHHRLPGETEAEFEELCDFLREEHLVRAGVFQYSPEEGTPAASMPDQVEPDVAAHRLELLVELQSRVMDAYNESRLGETVEVLCEGFDDEMGCFVGRTYADSPDIDGHVYFTAAGDLPAGTFVPVRLTDVADGDMMGEIDDTEAGESFLNTANKITLFRVILIPLFLLVCYLDFPYHLPVALAIFILASLSDFLDGYIARHRNQVTDFGKFMDPIADKVLVLSAMSMFVSWGRMPAWILVVVIARELAVSLCG